MFHNEQSYNRHNNNSKNSPSMAKSNQMNRNQSSKMESLNHSTIRPFENDDYDYLINCTDLITTCQVKKLFFKVIFVNKMASNFAINRKHYRRITSNTMVTIKLRQR